MISSTPRRTFRPKPDRRNAGEGMPPLPLPATPLRRSEKKREPSPPALVGNITFSQAALKSAGQRLADDHHRHREMGRVHQSAARASAIATSARISRKFSYDPTELPILYFTGWKPIPHFDDATIAKLRQYLMDGGTWVVHSNCGRPEFNESFREEIARIFPGSPARADSHRSSDLFELLHDHVDARSPKGSEPWKTIPTDRLARNDQHRHAGRGDLFADRSVLRLERRRESHRRRHAVTIKGDALKLGSNIVTYCLAEYQYGRFFRSSEGLSPGDRCDARSAGAGADSCTTAIGTPRRTACRICSRRSINHHAARAVQARAGRSGQGGHLQLPRALHERPARFQFSDAARKRLREYLDNGGTLVVDDVIGNSEFDRAFRREIKAIYPDQELKAAAGRSSDLELRHTIRTHVQTCAAGRAELLGGSIDRAASLKSIEVDGTAGDLFTAEHERRWEQLPRAYNRGYADEDALKLGVNVLMYLVDAIEAIERLTECDDGVAHAIAITR